MPTDWIPNCGTQLERAIRALFIAGGAATHDDCFISNESTERGTLASGITTIVAQSSTHDPELSGNEKWAVTIQNKFGAALEPDETDTALNRYQLDRRVGFQMEQLMQSSTGGNLDVTCANITDEGRALAAATTEPDATNNADMAEFTCLFGRFLGSTRGKPDDASCAWVEVRNFEFTACPIEINENT